MTLTNLVIALAVVGIALLAAFLLTASNRGKVNSPAGRLSRWIAQRPDYQILIGVPFVAPKDWAPATREGEHALKVEGFGTIRISDARAFAVAYPNGQMVDAELYGLPLPKNLDTLWPVSHADSDVLRLDELKRSTSHIEVSYGPRATRPRDPGHYATTLKNISTERIRVLRFAGYKRTGEIWKLSTVTRRFYSAEEFREWYGLGSIEWIEPGQAVTDPNNYGSPPVLWAYYCESESGLQFVAGGVLD